MDALDLFPLAGIRFISVAHEQGGGHMADGYARVSGRHGVCIAQNGPGITNFVTSTAAAYWAHSPVVVITPETGSGTIGTPAYMSPEQAQGTEVDSRSDVYGLGVIIYQMLSGQQPYSADTPMGVVVKHITEPVPEILKVLPDLPPEIDTIIKTSMAKDKTARYSNTIELAKALNLVAFGSEGNITFNTNTGFHSVLFSHNSATAANGTGRCRCCVLVCHWTFPFAQSIILP
jgi:serine/threonine protein kinase